MREARGPQAHPTRCSDARRAPGPPNCSSFKPRDPSTPTQASSPDMAVKFATIRKASCSHSRLQWFYRVSKNNNKNNNNNNNNNDDSNKRDNRDRKMNNTGIKLLFALFWFTTYKNLHCIVTICQSVCSTVNCDRNDNYGNNNSNNDNRNDNNDHRKALIFSMHKYPRLLRFFRHFRFAGLSCVYHAAVTQHELPTLQRDFQLK